MHIRSSYNCGRYLLRIVFFAALLTGFGTSASAQNKKQLEREKGLIEKEIKRLNDELSSTKRKSKNSTAQINLLTKKIKERSRLINNINGQMRILDNQIVAKQDSIKLMKGHVDSLKAEYAKVVRQLYGLRQNINPATLLFDNENYNRTYLRMKYYRAYSDYRQHQAKHIRMKEEELEDVALDLQRQKNEKNTLLAQEQRTKDALSKEQQQQRNTLASAQQLEKSLKSQISRKEKEKQKLQAQIQKLINEEVARAARHSNNSTGRTGTPASGANPSSPSAANEALSADFIQNKGKLPWPVYYKKVSREYGRYTHASGGQNMNHGIDVVCAPGASVSCVFNGTVTRIFTTPNGAQGIIVRHGEYMSVYTNLNTVSVREGDKVSTKQNLGTLMVSDEGISDFSFQLWRSKDSLNPRHWLR